MNARLAAFQKDVSADVEILANIVKTVDPTLRYVPKVEGPPVDAGPGHQMRCRAAAWSPGLSRPS